MMLPANTFGANLVLSGDSTINIFGFITSSTVTPEKSKLDRTKLGDPEFLIFGLDFGKT